MDDGSGKSRPRGGAFAPLPRGTRVAVVVARWNETVTQGMLAAARHTPADRLAASGRYAAVLCLGAIIRGETSHDRHIATAVAGGIEQTARTRGLPVLFGVLTCDTPAQAAARSGGSAADGYAGNKGAECAAAALEMIAVLAAIGGPAVCREPTA